MTDGVNEWTGVRRLLSLEKKKTIQFDFHWLLHPVFCVRNPSSGLLTCELVPEAWIYLSKCQDEIDLPGPWKERPSSAAEQSVQFDLEATQTWAGLFGMHDRNVPVCPHDNSFYTVAIMLPIRGGT